MFLALDTEAFRRHVLARKQIILGIVTKTAKSNAIKLELSFALFQAHLFLKDTRSIIFSIAK